jgi:hypothetical protein
MVDRIFSKLGIHLATALELTVAVMSSPIRPFKSAGGALGRACLRSDFGVPLIPLARICAACPNSRRLAIKALPSEIEEDLKELIRAAHCSIELPRILSLEPAWQLATPALHKAPHPLRC